MHDADPESIQTKTITLPDCLIDSLKILWKVQHEQKLKNGTNINLRTLENEWFKILSNFKIQCENVTEHRRPDVIVVKKKQDRCVMVDVASSGDQAAPRKVNLVPVIIILLVKQYSRQQVILYCGSLVRQNVLPNVILIVGINV